jgi:preprotein translocase subunit SecG
MTTLFIILIVLCAVALGFVVLVQNPKGGGLAGNVAGFSSQFMGVKQTNDVLEKGTWIFAGLIALLCLTSTFFISGSGRSDSELDKIGTKVPAKTQPKTTNSVPFGTPPPSAPDTTKP